MHQRPPSNALLATKIRASSGLSQNATAQDPALTRAHLVLSQSAQNHTALLEGQDQNDPNPQDDDSGLSAARTRLITAIGAAAVLSNTPQKWAATIALLHRHGIDPAGYEDFGQGRLAAAEQAGLLAHIAKPIVEIPTG